MKNSNKLRRDYGKPNSLTNITFKANESSTITYKPYHWIGKEEQDHREN
jgi:hypothetical protein